MPIRNHNDLAGIPAELLPPMPPNTSYVMLEFPCIVVGALNVDAAYANAVAQLRATLEASPESLRMNFHTKEHYDSVNVDDEDDDQFDWPLVNCFSWPFGRDNFPASPEALIEEIAKAEALMHAELPREVIFDAQRLAELSGLTELDARFTVWFEGENNIKRIGDGSHDMTFAEILWLLHRSTLTDNLGDHFFFEALYGATPEGREIPLFDVGMGS